MSLSIEEDWIELIRRSNTLKWVISTVFFSDYLDDRFICKSIEKLTAENNEGIRLFVEGDKMTANDCIKLKTCLYNIPAELLEELQIFYTDEDAFEKLGFGHFKGPSLTTLKRTFSPFFNKFLKGFQIIEVKGVNIVIHVLVRYPPFSGRRGVGTALLERAKRILPYNGYIIALASSCESKDQYCFYTKHNFKFAKFDSPVRHARVVMNNVIYVIAFKKTFAEVPSFAPKNYYLTMYDVMCRKNSDVYEYIVQNMDCDISLLYDELEESEVKRKLQIATYARQKTNAAKKLFFEKHLCADFDSLQLDESLIATAVFHIENVPNEDEDEEEEEEHVVDVTEDLAEGFVEEKTAAVEEKKRKHDMSDDDTSMQFLKKCITNMRQQLQYHENTAKFHRNRADELRVLLAEYDGSKSL
jgi:hypothetical protein